MLKTIQLPNKLVFDKNNNNKLAFNKNNNKKSALRKNNNNGKINKFSINNDNIKYAKKLEKLKTRKLSKV